MWLKFMLLNCFMNEFVIIYVDQTVEIKRDKREVLYYVQQLEMVTGSHGPVLVRREG